MSSPQIDLYTASTPNGWKVSVFLEEVGLPYKVHKIDLTQATRKSPNFCASAPTAAFRQSSTVATATFGF